MFASKVNGPYHQWIVDFAHVQVDPETDWDQVGEEQDEPENVDVPGAVESLQAHHDEGQRHRCQKQ